MGLLSKMFGAERWEEGFKNIDFQIDEHLNAGRDEFVVQVKEFWFPGRFDVAMERVVDYLQNAGLSVRNVDMEAWAGAARVYVAAPVPAMAAAGPPGGAPGSSSIFQFDPHGPEKAADAAKAAYYEQDWGKAFQLYVKAIDRLHDFYCFEQFRNRQPSPADAWIVNGLVSALGALLATDPQADVHEGVRQATHRLRAISTATEAAGGNAQLYRGGLDGLAGEAGHIDVSDIFWH